jgi:hypothetical protein
LLLAEAGTLHKKNGVPGTIYCEGRSGFSKGGTAHSGCSIISVCFATAI